MEKKTRRLKCIVTGKVLIATKEYYKRKLDKVGNEKKLLETYICKEAKSLLVKGYTVEKIREMLNVSDPELTDVSTEVINSVINLKPSYKIINNTTDIPISSIINPQTDPEVKQFIQNIMKQS